MTKTEQDYTITIIKCTLEYTKHRGSKLERLADKMREISAVICWLLPLYMVCVLCQSAKTNQTVTL